VRLREDETSLIAGLLDKEETRSLTGLPGFAELPAGAGHLFGVRDNSTQDTELLILVTPRRLRLPERDTRVIYAGRGRKVFPEGAAGFLPAGATEGPIAPQTQPEPQQPEQPAPQPQPEPPQPPL
jgi:general secretion pathway protein D